MPKYLLQASLTVEGLKGTIEEGGTSRREAVTQFVESLGGKVEAAYYAFGYTDVFIIVDMPHNVAATAASLILNVAGTTKTTMTVLITPEEVDEATALAREKTGAYRPPGQ
jgi:uncharacterized protein with GYD domain